MDDLLNDVTGFVVFFFVTESDESSDNVSNESSEEDKNKESNELSIYFYALWTHYCSFAFSVAYFAAY